VTASVPKDIFVRTSDRLPDDMNSFTFRAYDGQEYSEPATVSVETTGGGVSVSATAST